MTRIVIAVPGDEHAAMAETNQLRREFRDAGLRVSSSVPAAGDKGAFSDILLDPATPAEMMCAVRALHLWLKRDRNRSIVVRSEKRNRTTETTISGENISVSAIHAALRELGEGRPE